MSSIAADSHSHSHSAPDGFCRVVYVHAGKNKGTKQLKQDRHHTQLFRDALRLCFADSNTNTATATPGASPCNLIEDLPRGQILGVMLLTEAFWFKRDAHKHFDAWILGPFVYRISDVVRLDEGVAVDGKLGKWSPSPDMHARIMQQTSVQRKLAQWQRQYGDRLYVGENDIPCAMTIHQPFVEAILCGVKKFENRKRPMFPLHPKLKPSPPSPDMTECRFCPSAPPPPQISDASASDTPSQSQSQCTYWAHSVKSTSSANGTPARGKREHNKKKTSRKTRPPKTKIVQETDVDEDEDSDVSVHDDKDEAFAWQMFHADRSYNTRSKKSINKSASSVSTNSLSSLESKTKTKSSLGKRKRVDVDADETESSSKKAKLAIAADFGVKKKKKDRKKRAHASHDVDEQWPRFLQDMHLGEEGESPLRMCVHGSVMQPVAHAIEDAHSCDMCAHGRPIEFDHFYVCQCHGETTDYCYHHTQPITIAAAQRWKTVQQQLSASSVQQVQGIFERMRRQFQERKKSKKSNSKKSRKTKKEHAGQQVLVGVDNGPQPRQPPVLQPLFSTKSATAAATNPFSRLPTFDIGVNGGHSHPLAHSIDFVRLQNLQKRQQTDTSTLNTNHTQTSHLELDFSSFPSIIAPTTSHAHADSTSSSLRDRTVIANCKPYWNGAGPTFVTTSNNIAPVNINQSMTNHTPQHTASSSSGASLSSSSSSPHANTVTNGPTLNRTRNQQVLSSLLVQISTQGKHQNANTKQNISPKSDEHNGGDKSEPQSHHVAMPMPISSVAQPHFYQPATQYQSAMVNGEQKLLIPLQYYNPDNNMYWHGPAAATASSWYPTTYASHSAAVPTPQLPQAPIACNDS